MRVLKALKAASQNEAAIQNVTAASAAGGKDKFMLAAGFILGLTDVQAIESPRPHGILQGVIAIPEGIPVYSVPAPLPKHTEHAPTETSRAPDKPIPSGSNKPAK